MRSTLKAEPFSARLANRLRVVTIAATVFMTVAACGGDNASAPAGDAKNERVFLVDLAKVQIQDINVTLDAVGTAYASGQVDIRPQVSGTLVAAPFVEGQEAEAGKILVQLDDSKAKASLALAQAQLDSAKAKQNVAAERLGRFRRLAAEDLVSREEFATLESEQKAAAASVREHEAEVRLAERNLEDFTLRAPISGRMGIRYVDEGNFVEAGTIISTLVAADPLEVLFTVPNSAMQGIEIGQNAEIRATDAARTLLGMARVRVIDASVDTDTRMIRVKAVVANPDGVMKAGQFVAVSLVREHRPDAVVVPEDAVIPFAGKTFVYVVSDGHASRREVTLGVRLPAIVEVLTGLKASDTIVTRGQHRLRDGAAVKQQQGEDADAASTAAKDAKD